jgi:thymidine phosphorylase
MISGRGLGHTGGTLDKLESIPGFRTNLTEDQLRAQMATTPCAIVSASAEIAPADRRLYLIRDVTGTVESIDLITASILSKKLAAGLEGLVLDVKVGSGAFMKTMDQADALARALVATAQGAGCMTTALITDMSQPLATAAGNALEVIEVMETLTGTSVNAALRDLTAALGGEALALGGLAADPQDGARRIEAALKTGKAAEMFGRMVAAQGGPSDFVDHWPDRLPSAPVQREVPCLRGGFVTGLARARGGVLRAGRAGARRLRAARPDPAGRRRLARRLARAAAWRVARDAARRGRRCPRPHHPVRHAGHRRGGRRRDGPGRGRPGGDRSRVAARPEKREPSGEGQWAGMAIHSGTAALAAQPLASRTVSSVSRGSRR